jgi:DNA gyrase subunit A
MVEQSILAAMDAIRARPNSYHKKSLAVLAAVEEGIGLAPGYAYEMVLDLARPWVVPIRLVDFHGNFGGRDYDAAGPRYTECRLSPAGGLALRSERGEVPPLPIGLINGNIYAQGLRPPLDPLRAITALRRLVDKPRSPSREIVELVGPPEFLTGCDLSGDLDSFMAGRPTALRLTGRVVVGDDSHLIIETLPPNARPHQVIETIIKVDSPRWDGTFPQLGAATRLGIASIDNHSTSDDVLRLICTLRPGVDPHQAAERLRRVPGVVTEIAVAHPVPLADLLRAWVKHHQSEDLITALDSLETTLTT